MRLALGMGADGRRRTDAIEDLHGGCVCSSSVIWEGPGLFSDGVASRWSEKDCRPLMLKRPQLDETGSPIEVDECDSTSGKGVDEIVSVSSTLVVEVDTVFRGASQPFLRGTLQSSVCLVDDADF